MDIENFIIVALTRPVILSVSFIKSHGTSLTSFPNLKDETGLEDVNAQFNFYFQIHLLQMVFNLFPSNRVYPAKFTDKCIEN